MKLFDTHCHLDADFDGLSVHEIVKRALDAGVERIVLPAVSPQGWERCLEIAHQNPGVFVGLGIHPQCVRDLTPTEIEEGLKRLDEMLHESKVVAVGEIGLDHRWDSDADARCRQEDVFVAQLDLACAHHLPPIIHVLDAHGRFGELWRDHPCRRATPGIMHSYSGSAELVRVYTQQNLFISFSGGVTWKGAKRVPKACQATPDEWLLIETDAPYQPPHPLEKDANRPDKVLQVAEFVARLRGITLEEVARLTFDNANRVFGLDQAPSS